MKYKILISVMLTLSVMLILGCSDRATEPDDAGLERGVFTNHEHVFFDEFILQVNNPNQLMVFMHYLPEIAWGMDHPLPLLVLLAPEGEDLYFYVHHGLGELASEMIASGEIEPMVIVTIPPESIDEIFGGYFYAGDQHPGGKYDDIFATKLLDHLNTILPAQIIADPAKHGIGGIGMGAYGAFRAALLNPGDWGSVSAVDGPLDFDGADGMSGLIDLMDSVFVEQPNLTQENFRAAFDSSSSNPISRLFCGGGLAFTPHDQNLDSLINVDTLEFIGELPRLQITLDEDLRGTIYHILPDSTTLIDSLIAQDARNMDFHIPFSFDSRPYDPIWDIWLEENLENLYSGSDFMNTDVWIASSPEAKWGYHDMTMSWATTLGPNVVTVYEYEGYEGRPATGNQYVYDLLREMLKFHNVSFNK